jgi:hypothetical protein
LASEQLVQRWLGGGVELAGFCVIRSEEGDGIDTEERIFIGSAREQEFARWRLPGLYSALDLVSFVERAIGVQRDFEFACRGFVHFVGKQLHVFRLEAGHGIASGQIPFGLRRGRSSGERDSKRQKQFFHGFSRVRGLEGGKLVVE